MERNPSQRKVPSIFNPTNLKRTPLTTPSLPPGRLADSRPSGSRALSRALAHGAVSGHTLVVAGPWPVHWPQETRSQPTFLGVEIPFPFFSSILLSKNRIRFPWASGGFLERFGSLKRMDKEGTPRSLTNNPWPRKPEGWGFGDLKPKQQHLPNIQNRQTGKCGEQQPRYGNSEEGFSQLGISGKPAKQNAKCSTSSMFGEPVTD